MPLILTIIDTSAWHYTLVTSWFCAHCWDMNYLMLYLSFGMVCLHPFSACQILAHPSLLKSCITFSVKLLYFCHRLENWLLSPLCPPMHFIDTFVLLL
jgi:uncharacterized membrane protein